MAVPAHRTAEANNQLREGIDLLLGRWSALQMAIQNDSGGRETRQITQQLAVDIYHWLIRPADNLIIMHEECLKGNFVTIERLRKSIPASNLRMQVVNGGEDSTSSSEDESMEMAGLDI